MSHESDVDVAVVGAGIAGLTAAHRLRAAGRSPVVFEADGAVGGRMKAHRRDGWIVEEGTETLATRGYPATWRLIRDVGLDRPGQVLKVRSLSGVWRHGRAHAGTGHWVGALTGAGLSPAGRMALGALVASLLPSAGRFDTRRPGTSPLGTRTVSQFASGRRHELLDYVLQPAVSTGWGWDPERSCVAPLVATMIATRGLLGWRTYRDGMDALARRVAAGLDLRTGRTVTEVKDSPAGVRLDLAGGDVVTARATVLAVPSPLARTLFPDAPAGEREFLRAASYAPMIRVTCPVDRPLSAPQRRGTPPVYALLVPDSEDGYVSGLTFEHLKAGNRAPAGRGLVSILTSPRATRELLDAPDHEIADAVLPRAERYAPGLRAALRTRPSVHRFRHAAPEATPEALRLQSGFLDRPVRAVEYAGDWVFQRPTSEAAVQSGELAAHRLLSRRPM
ncbi:FAD-dependent oxidoreductase [Streptomyces tubbatahanensis]|uniref:FAD-dependent oxidoreductase n=1 Tax=Streptomyces tubbatahanensis TaxID=2923272 RepID=A0ABY3XMR3_9ACTN|nr:NAD(P)/FAD-dependent oxidoreductase [Streptomyces tubbatahanensis]UNS95728.1 FAD-dependent oxidoreductase [Streptomyces tubbatahanensis]